MFGYVRIRKADLRVKEYEYYRATYCGLCRSMGKCTGQCSRLALSYDIAFLSQVRMALVDTVPQFKKRRCIRHPFLPRMMMEQNGELAFGADASALLVYEKCRDDMADKRGLGKLLSGVRCLLFRSAYRRAKKRLPELTATVRNKLAELSAIEAKRSASVDAPAAVFGELLAAIFEHGLSGNAARIARIIGDKVGRFIYITDAIDDAERDQKSGNFNPVLLLYGAKPGQEERRALEDALLSSLSDAAKALDLICEAADSPRRAVLDNILYLGMPDTARRVIFGERACCKEATSEQQPL